MEKYDGKCIVTGIDISKLLIASHIKPWAISNNHDRISSENGLDQCQSEKEWESGNQSNASAADEILKLKQLMAAGCYYVGEI